MIKFDIVTNVVNRTGLSKTRAEMAVETVFETMKRAMKRGERLELRGFGVFSVRPRKPASAVIREPEKKCGFRPVRPFASNLARGSSSWTLHQPVSATEPVGGAHYLRGT